MESIAAREASSAVPLIYSTAARVRPDCMGTVAYLDRAAAGPQVADATLVERGQKGDEAALEALFRRHAAAMNRLALRLTCSRADAEDLVQDAFVYAFASLRRLERAGSFLAWLRAILVRTAAKRLRRRRIARRLGLAVETPLDPQSVIADDAPPDVALELRQLLRVLDDTPANNGLALVLFRVEGMTLGEIAEAFGVSEPTIKRRIKRAQRVLDALRAAEGGR